MSTELEWLKRNEEYKDIVMKLEQPTTAAQLSKRMHITLDAARFRLLKLAQRRHLQCVNETARRSRLYWFTRLGLTCQQELRRLHGLPPCEHQLPVVDWNLYGWTCFAQRSAIMKATQEHARPAEIRRRAKAQDPELRMTTVHICRGIKGLVKKGLIKKVANKGGRPKYVFTRTGREIWRLHHRASTPL